MNYRRNINFVVLMILIFVSLSYASPQHNLHLYNKGAELGFRNNFIGWENYITGNFKLTNYLDIRPVFFTYQSETGWQRYDINVRADLYPFFRDQDAISNFKFIFGAGAFGEFLDLTNRNPSAAFINEDYYRVMPSYEIGLGYNSKVLSTELLVSDFVPIPYSFNVDDETMQDTTSMGFHFNTEIRTQGGILGVNADYNMRELNRNEMIRAYYETPKFVYDRLSVKIGWETGYVFMGGVNCDILESYRYMTYLNTLCIIPEEANNWQFEVALGLRALDHKKARPPKPKEKPRPPVQTKEDKKPDNRMCNIMIHFDTGSYDIKEASKKRLLEFIESTKDTTGLKIIISGHTDLQPNNNYVLSLKRAMAVRDYLLDHGLDENAHYIDLQALENQRSLDPNDNPKTGSWLNRRAEVNIEGCH